MKIDKLKQIRDNILEEIKNSKTLEIVEEKRIKFLSKKGEIPFRYLITLFLEISTYKSCKKTDEKLRLTQDT